MLSLKQRIGSYRNKYLNPRVVFCMDMVISVLVSSLVALIAWFLAVPAMKARLFVLFWLVSSAVFSALMFWLLSTFTIIIRHFTFKDTFKFVVASLGKALLMGVALLVWQKGGLSHRLMLMLVSDALLSMLVFILIRYVMIMVYESYKEKVRDIQRCMRVLVYGLSEKSVATVTRLANSRHYNVVGFITPDTSVDNTMLMDKRIYGIRAREEFQTLADRLSLGAVLFAKDVDVQNEQNRLVDFCSQLSVKVLISPSIDELSENSQFHVREVKIEDLLGREEIEISLKEIRESLTGKVVMVTGAAGSIGSELCRQLANFGIQKLVLFDNAETPMHNLRLELEERFPKLDFVPIIGDVRLNPRLEFAFSKYKPQVVFHAAAYKHVPLMEENPCEAVLVNVAGSRNVANKCIEHDVEKMVMISTDKAVNPTNIMGCTKRLAEIYVQSLGQALVSGVVEGKTKFVTTRFGNVLGSNGSVIPRFRDQIAKGGPLTVTHKDITRYFMTIPEACRLVMEAAILPTQNRICVFDMGRPVKIDTLARRMIELSGLIPDEDIKIEYTGLRPGEKLYEEVLSNVENTDPTSHDRIRIAHVREYDYNEAVKYVDELERLSSLVLIPEMVMLMKEIVPEYISKNSKFQIYDKQQ